MGLTHSHAIEQALASVDGVLDKLQFKIDEMSQEAERLTDTQSNKGALKGNKDLDKAKEAIKVRMTYSSKDLLFTA